MQLAFPGSLRGRARGPSLLPCVLGLAALLLCGSCGGTSAPVEISRSESRPNTRVSTGGSTTSGNQPANFPVSQANTRAASAHSQQETAASGFTLLDNSHKKLGDYAGQVVVLDFYATWCPPCRQETPHLVELQRRYGQRGLRVIGLNVGGPDDRDKVPGFVKEYGIQYTLAFPDAEMPDLYLSDDDTIPQAFIFDRQGRFVKRFISFDDTVPAQMESVIQKALAE